MSWQILHVFPAFGHGGVPIRIASIINFLGTAFRHSIVSLDGCYGSQSRLRDDLDIELLGVEQSKSSVARAVAQAHSFLRTRNPDLLMTYNWGAIEWAMAASLRPRCRLIHCESGFGPEEVGRQISRRVLFRRIALARAQNLIVPSRTLVDIAAATWKLKAHRIAYIPNGVDYDRFSAPPNPTLCADLGLDRFEKRLLVGTAAPLRPEKNLPRLLRAFARLDPELGARLVILGDGSEREALCELARELDLTDRVLFAGHVEAVESVLGAFDLFVMSSDTEQMPNSLIQAMASGLPVAATDVGDVRLIVSSENREFIVAPGDPQPLADAISKLLRDRGRRTELGRANRRKVERDFRQERMFESYKTLILDALGPAH